MHSHKSIPKNTEIDNTAAPKDYYITAASPGCTLYG